MKPHEFWDLAPVEVTAFISEAEKMRIEASWMHAFLQRMDIKKFPRSPEELWKPKKTSQNNLLQTAMALKAQQDRAKRREARGAGPATTRREA